MSGPIPSQPGGTEETPQVAQRIILVASGKGGVGKTTVTVNLALALSSWGARTGIFDADVYGPNVPAMLGVRRKADAHGLALVPIARAGRGPYIPALDRYGIKMMSTGLLVGETQAVISDSHLVGQMVTRTLKDVMWGDLDYLLVDLPPGAGEPQQSLLHAFTINGVLLVTTPQDLSLLDTGRSLSMYRQAGVPVLGVVENMSFFVCPECGKRVEVFHRTERKWAIEDEKVELLGRIPMEIGISRGISSGHPLVETNPKAPEAEAFLKIARKVMLKLPVTRRGEK